MIDHDGDDYGLFRECVRVADTRHDGRLTILKSATDWKVGFAQVNGGDGFFACGNTFAEAAHRALMDEEAARPPRPAKRVNYSASKQHEPRAAKREATKRAREYERAVVAERKTRESVDRKERGLQAFHVFAAKASVALELYDSLKIGGKSVGDIYYHELERYRYDGAFEFALCDQLIGYGIPNAPTRVRDMVKLDDLARMAERARAIAKGERRDAVRLRENHLDPA